MTKAEMRHTVGLAVLGRNLNLPVEHRSVLRLDSDPDALNFWRVLWEKQEWKKLALSHAEDTP